MKVAPCLPSAPTNQEIVDTDMREGAAPSGLDWPLPQEGATAATIEAATAATGRAALISLQRVSLT